MQKDRIFWYVRTGHIERAMAAWLTREYQKAGKVSHEDEFNERLRVTKTFDALQTLRK